MKLAAPGLLSKANCYREAGGAWKRQLLRGVFLGHWRKSFERSQAGGSLLHWLRRFGRWHALAFEGFSARALPGSFFVACCQAFFPHCLSSGRATLACFGRQFDGP